MSIPQETKEKIIRVVSALVPEATIILYGSHARGTETSSSDIDLALDAGVQIEPRRRVGEVREALSALYIPYQFDVVDVYGVSPTMKSAIMEEGIIWRKTTD